MTWKEQDGNMTEELLLEHQRGESMEEIYQPFKDAIDKTIQKSICRRVER